MARKTKKGKQRLDKFYQLAKDQGYRARSAFKLIQLAKKNDFLSKSTVCIDLCAAPGGWCQVAQKHMAKGSTIIGIDLCPIKAIQGVTTMQCDITTDKCRSMLKKELLGKRADCVLHDGAPNVGTAWIKDAYAQNELTLYAMKLACEHLRIGGAFVTKVFRSSDYNSLMWVFQQLFSKVEATKPTASRNVSAEIFVMCLGFKGGKIDPKFYDPKWVFMENLDAAEDKEKATKSAGATISEYLKSCTKRHRGGYEEGDDMRIAAAHDFIATENPAEMLVTHHRLSLTVSGSEELDKHPSTTGEVRELCADLKVLGKKDLAALLKWRIKIIRERERVERAAKKAEAAAKKAQGNAEAKAEGAGGLEDAIDGLLGLAEEGDATGKKGETDDIAAEEKLEEELAEQVEKRRREERTEKKKTMERQKKQDMRRKMSLGNARQDQDQPELFRISNSTVNALEDQDKYMDATAMDSDADADAESEYGNLPESDSDDELDRFAKMEVDIAVTRQLKSMQLDDTNRNKQQRIKKRKKETRRQRVVAAWAGEMRVFNDAIDQRASEEMAVKDQDSDDDGASDSDSDDEEGLRRLRMFQDGTSGLDTLALETLVDGPISSRADNDVAPAEANSEDEPVDEGRSNQVQNGIVPFDEDEMREQRKRERWFDQDIFKGPQSGQLVPRKAKAMVPLDRNSDDESENSDVPDMQEFEDDQLPQLPMTDKERRKLKRKREAERAEKRGKARHGDDEEDKTPMEIAPLEPPKPLVPTGPTKPEDPRELAETLALGSVLTGSKKGRMDLIDAGYNRWAFDKDDMLPDWFTQEEEKCNKAELPVSKELMAEFRAKLREINARPIRKVAEARARKKRRLSKKLEKLRSTAMSLTECSDMSEAAKARQMRKEVRKLAKEEERKVTVVAVKKGGGGKAEKGKIARGSKVKVVDRRMKSDLRGQKKAAKRNGSKLRSKKSRQMQKKQSRQGGKKKAGKKK